jgi:hypothetical protein
MYAIIEGERRVVEYPSVNVTAGDAPIERSTGEGVGSVSEVTEVDTVVVRTVASSGISTETVAPDEPTCNPLDEVSRM